MTELRELSAEGPRVVVRTIRAGDAGRYRKAVQLSRARLARWNPVDPDDLPRHLSRQSDVHRTFLVLARDDEGAHGVVGRVNLTNVVRGRFQSGVLGYDAFDPYAGRGLFAEGLSLVVGLALRPASDGGAGLHRVEANVQPGNVTSAGLLRSLGFRHEGHTPRMLLLAGERGGERWRDHERYAVTVEEWPPPPYQPNGRPRLVAVVGGPDANRRTRLAAALSAELGLPLLVGRALLAAEPSPVPSAGPSAGSPTRTGLTGSANPTASRSVTSPSGSAGPATSSTGSAASATSPSGTAASVVADSARSSCSSDSASSTDSSGSPGLDASTLWAVLADCPGGAVVQLPWGPDAAPEVQAGLHRAAVRVAEAVQVWCGSPDAPEPGDGRPAPAGWGLGHAVPVAGADPLGAAEVTRVALATRGLGLG